MRRPQLDALTGARFFAALAVMCTHYAGRVPFPGWLMPIIAQGRAGVSFFFILSGFILAYNYYPSFQQGVSRPAFWSFLRARLARIYPMHVVSLLTFTPVVLYGLWGAQASVTSQFGPVTSTNLLAAWALNLCLLHIYVPTMLFAKLWHPVSWSIGTEMFFYLAFPFVAARAQARVQTPARQLSWAVGLFVIEVALFVGALALLTLGPSDSRYTLLELVVYRMPFFRIWEFLIGATLGACFLKWRATGQHLPKLLNREGGRNALLIGALLGACALCYLPLPAGNLGKLVEYSRWYVAFTPCFAVLVLVLACGRTVLSRLLEHPWAILLGEASYSLYLIHLLGLSALEYHSTITGVPVSPFLATAAMPLLVAASIGCLKLVELPARRFLRGPAPEAWQQTHIVAAPSEESLSRR